MSEVHHQACPQSKICHVLQRVFFCRQRLFCLCFKPTGSKEMITEKCCAGAEVVCPADSIRACWCFHSLKHRESKHRSMLQSRCGSMLHCEFSVDFKNWQICALAYRFGLLLSLLFSRDMNKFPMQRECALSRAFFYYVFRFGFVCSQLAQSTGGEQRSV